MAFFNKKKRAIFITNRIIYLGCTNSKRSNDIIWYYIFFSMEENPSNRTFKTKGPI